MRKADRETESRKLIGGKLREARMADNSPMTEADAEYYRILAEARATHASKENTRKSAKKHAFTSAAAILLILAVAGGSFILGMQSDVRASADPDDERKVVQQGDNNIVITYYDVEDIPKDIEEDCRIISIADLHYVKTIVRKTSDIITFETYYYVISQAEEKKSIVIRTQRGAQKIDEIESMYRESCFEYKDNIVEVNVFDESIEYRVYKDNIFVSIIMPEQIKTIKIETILDGLEI